MWIHFFCWLKNVYSNWLIKKSILIHFWINLITKFKKITIKCFHWLKNVITMYFPYNFTNNWMFKFISFVDKTKCHENVTPRFCWWVTGYRDVLSWNRFLCWLCLLHDLIGYWCNGSQSFDQSISCKWTTLKNDYLPTFAVLRCKDVTCGSPWHSIPLQLQHQSHYIIY